MNQTAQLAVQKHSKKNTTDNNPRPPRTAAVLVFTVLVATVAALTAPLAAQTPLESLGPVLESGAPIDLSFAEPHPSHRIYRALERAFDVEIVVDRHFKDEPVSVELKNVGLAEALEALNERLDAFYVVRGPNAVTVAKDTPQNRRRYEPHYVARFRIRDVDPGTAMNSLRALVDVRKIALDEAGPTLVVRGTKATVQQAARVLEELDQPRDTVELQIDAFAVPSLERLAELDVTLPTARARQALRSVGAEPVLQQRSTITVGREGRLEAVSQPYIGKELGWEGLTMEHRVRSGDRGSVTLEAHVLGACVSPTLDGSLRRDRRDQTLQARIESGQSVWVLDAVPAAGAPVEGRGNTCGLLAEAATTRTLFVLLITPTVRPAPRRPLEVDAWLAGTESYLEPVELRGEETSSP